MRNAKSSVLLIAIFLISGVRAETLILYPTDWTTISGITENGHEEARLLVHYDLSGIPDKAKILDASIYFDEMSIPNNPIEVCIYTACVISEWDAECADWVSPDGGSEWNSPGGDWEFDQGDYGCLDSSVFKEPRLNITTLIRGVILRPETFQGLIFLSILGSSCDIDEMMFVEIMVALKPRLEIRFLGSESVGKKGYSLSSESKE